MLCSIYSCAARTTNCMIVSRAYMKWNEVKWNWSDKFCTPAIWNSIIFHLRHKYRTRFLITIYLVFYMYEFIIINDFIKSVCGRFHYCCCYFFLLLRLMLLLLVVVVTAVALLLLLAFIHKFICFVIVSLWYVSRLSIIGITLNCNVCSVCACLERTIKKKQPHRQLK